MHCAILRLAHVLQFLSSCSFCHPEEAESLACERLPTKDLCICSGNGPPKCRPIALTEGSFRTQQRHAKVPPGCQQARPNPNQIRLERKRIENLSYIRRSQNLCHPERCPNRAGAARASRGTCYCLRDRGSGRNWVPVDGTQARKARPNFTGGPAEWTSRPVPPRGDVMLSEALFAERRTWARAVRRLAFFARQERTFGAYASGRAPSPKTRAKGQPTPQSALNWYDTWYRIETTFPLWTMFPLWQ